MLGHTRFNLVLTQFFRVSPGRALRLRKHHEKNSPHHDVVDDRRRNQSPSPPAPKRRSAENPKHSLLRSSLIFRDASVGSPSSIQLPDKFRLQLPNEIFALRNQDRSKFPCIFWKHLMTRGTMESKRWSSLSRTFVPEIILWWILSTRMEHSCCKPKLAHGRLLMDGAQTRVGKGCPGFIVCSRTRQQC